MGASCPNTGNMGEFLLQGQVGGYAVSKFNYGQPQTMVSTINFFNDSIQFPMWQVCLQQSVLE